MPVDNFPVLTPDMPAAHAAAITPSNATVLDPLPRAIYVGVGGDITVDTVEETDVLFKAVPQGTILPVRAMRVKATGTAATNLVALR